MPVNPSSLPDFDDLPPFKNFTGCAWGVYGDEGHLGSVAMLGPEVVVRAAREEIRYVVKIHVLGCGEGC